MRIRIIELIVAAGLIGCTPVERLPSDYIKPGETLINCTSNLDNTSILYYKSKATEHVSDSMPVTIWYIEDVKGKLHSLNNYEIENYVCTQVTK